MSLQVAAGPGGNTKFNPKQSPFGARKREIRGLGGLGV